MKAKKYIGVVQVGAARGRTLGFPTANIMIDSDAEEGLYVGYVLLDGVRMPSLIFIGANITFGEHEKKAEIHILDFDQDLYGREITSEVSKKLRDNRKYTTAEALIEQMKIDLIDARTYFKNKQKKTC